MLLMDGEKKRKRTDKGDVNGGGDRSKHEVETTLKAEEEAVVLPPPSEEEVDEFFAILRRMHVAVKYLQRNAQIRPENVNAPGNKLDIPPAGVNGVAAGQKKAQGIVRKVGLDLNTLPDGGD
ncbi:protein NIM1-INTERACTING 2-like [Solanum dulcamara]|uniref:protein NIM1-INTERACTING 2-like n=1 Tax=Solanum dulcamara TaxID=45834 RepID=UPI002485C4CF|nr:protein NIM1-INTERACTING 2-like [Solanum dulcamara]